MISFAECSFGTRQQLNRGSECLLSLDYDSKLSVGRLTSSKIFDGTNMSVTSSYAFPLREQMHG